MSLLDRLEVPLAQSCASTIAVVRPRVTASSAAPAPTTPPPTTSTSTSSAVIPAIAALRDAGDSPSVTGIPFLPVSRSADFYPVEGALDCLLPVAVAGVPLFLRPLRVPALGL